MEWTDWLRLAALLSMAYGAYETFKRSPKPFSYEGRKYYPLPDGRFCTRWGKIVKDSALEQALRERVESDGVRRGDP